MQTYLVICNIHSSSIEKFHVNFPLFQIVLEVLFCELVYDASINYIPYILARELDKSSEVKSQVHQVDGLTESCCTWLCTFADFTLSVKLALSMIGFGLNNYKKQDSSIVPRCHFQQYSKYQYKHSFCQNFMHSFSIPPLSAIAGIVNQRSHQRLLQYFHPFIKWKGDPMVNSLQGHHVSIT